MKMVKKGNVKVEQVEAPPRPVGEIFRPAKEVKPIEGLKILVWGATNTGKSHFSLTAPRPTFVIDTEFGIAPIKHKHNQDDLWILEVAQFDPVVKDVDISRSLELLEEALRSVISYIDDNPDVKGTIVIDSITDVWTWLGIWLEEDAAEVFTKTGVMMQSVPPDSPVFTLEDGYVKIKPISAITAGDVVWDKDGWTRVKYVAIHETNSPVVRVFSDAGVVDCTTDHSLVQNGEEVSPLDAERIDLVEFPKPNYTCHTDAFIAYIVGKYLADGTRGYSGGRGRNKGKYTSYYITSSDKSELLELKKELSKLYDNYSAKVVQYKNEYGKWYRLQLPYSIKQYLDRCYVKDYKVVPDYILNTSIKAKEAFLNGFVEGDGSRKHGHIRITQKSPLVGIGVQYVAESIGYNVRFHRHTKDNVYYIMTLSKDKSAVKPTGKVMHVVQHPAQPMFVYDIETESHMWASGKLRVHNTEWKKANRRYYKMILKLLRSKWHVIATAKEDVVRDEKGNPTNQYMPKVQKNTEYWFDIIMRSTLIDKNTRKFTITKFRSLDVYTTFTNPTWDDVIKFIEEQLKTPIK